VNSSSQTLLTIVCNCGKLEAVKQRYNERPEDLNLSDNALNTPLYIASLIGYLDIVEFLLDTGHCELDCVNLEKDTPLYDTVDNRHIEVVKLLLNAGANLNKLNLADNEPLDLLDLILDQDRVEGDEDKNEQVTTKIELAEMREAIIAAKQKFAVRNIYQKVADKAQLAEQWEEKVTKVLEDAKPSLKVIQTLVNEGEQILYKLKSLLSLKQFVDRCNK
jgi:hypothetical protein